MSIQLGQASGDQVVPFAAGSGVVISADGLVLTNAHVVDGADVIQVQLSDKRTIRADLVGTSPSHDIALVRLRDTTDLVPATLGSSDAMQVGDQVVAIGNALDLGDTPTVTTGIVSAKGRTLEDGQTTLEEPDPDRRRHQPRQLGRPAAERGRPGRRHQLGRHPGRREPGLRHRDRRHPPAHRRAEVRQGRRGQGPGLPRDQQRRRQAAHPDEANQLGVQRQGRRGRRRRAAAVGRLRRRAEGRRHPQAGRRQGRQRTADAPRRHPGPPAGLDHLDRGRSGRPAEDRLGRPRLAAVTPRSAAEPASPLRCARRLLRSLGNASARCGAPAAGRSVARVELSDACQSPPTDRGPQPPPGATPA